jgi:hypothetical protein
MQFHIPSVLQGEPAVSAPAPEEPDELGVDGPVAVAVAVPVKKTPGATDVAEARKIVEVEVTNVVMVDMVVCSGAVAADVAGTAADVAADAGLVLPPDPPKGAGPDDPPPIPFTAAQVPV